MTSAIMFSSSLITRREMEGLTWRTRQRVQFLPRPWWLGMASLGRKTGVSLGESRLDEQQVGAIRGP
jgi:hypothetical protein